MRDRTLPPRARRTVRAQLLRVVLLTTAIAVAVACAAMLGHEIYVYRTTWAAHLAGEAAILAVSTAPALAVDDHLLAERNLSALQARPRVMVAALYSVDGRIFASYVRAGTYAPPAAPPPQGSRAAGSRIELTQPVLRDGEVLGMLYLRARYDLVGRLETYFTIFVPVMILSVAVAYFFSRRLQKGITGPLDAMAHAARDIVTRRDYSVRAAKLSDNEIGVVVDAFNNMLEEVQHSNLALQEGIAVRDAAQKALRTSEKLYRAVGESIDYGVWVCDRDGRNIYASESFLRLLGCSQQQCAALAWGDRLHPDDVAATVAAWEQSVKSGSAWYREHRVLGADGEYHPILAQGVPITGENGEVTGWAGINLDISRLKLTEAALREADRRKDEFLATLAHELRNPLAPIRHAVRLLELTELDAQRYRWAREVISRQVQRMGLLLDDLLDVSRITRGRLQLKIEAVNLESLVNAAVETARPLIDSKQHELTVDLPPRPVTLAVDALRVSQSLSNLLTNAAKYTDALGRIRLSVTLSPHEITMSVTDNGIGFAPDAAAGMFDMFAQVDSVIDRAEGGLGIGLALVKGLMELHHGSVDGFSAGMGRGSEFTLHFPISALVGAVDPESREVPAPRPARQASFHVLVADDNQDAADSLGLLLELGGYEVAVAHSGKDALRLAEVRRPHAMILDIGMPDLTGYEVARHVRGEPWGHGVLLAAITGWGQADDKARARAAGFDHHFTKPVDPADVEKLLQEYFALSYPTT